MNGHVTRNRLWTSGATFTLALIGSSVETLPAGPPVSAERVGTEVVVRVGQVVFTHYKFADSQKYPYFWPVNGPASGKSVTTESAQPYPHHHSLFFGCDHVNGGNYWQDANARGQIVSRQVTLVEPKGDAVVFEDRCRWQRPAQPPVFEDVRRFTITAPDDRLRFIDAAITLKALVDVHITRTNHSLFAARVIEALSVKGGGAMINSAGQRGEKATFGQTARWIDMAGSRDGVTEGIAILDHPSNPWFPCTWFTRDYGFMSPTPMYWLGPDGYRMKKGQTLALRYRVVVHVGQAKDVGLDEIWKRWSTE